MWEVKIPSQRVGQSVKLCCSGTTRRVELRDRVAASLEDIERCSSSFETAARSNAIHVFAETHAHLAEVTPAEMTWMYENRMVSSSTPGRAIYDELMLLPEHQICPICNQRTVASLDHFLPKSDYSALALDPMNLVAVCQECNHIKLSTFPLGDGERYFHPYFESVDSDIWLHADVLECAPAAVLYSVKKPASWDEVKATRVANHFRSFKLAKLYASHSARKLSGMQRSISRLYGSSGADRVRSYLNSEADSHSVPTKNNWEVALYRALASSEWYINGGFAA